MKPALAIVGSDYEYEIDRGIPVPPRRSNSKYPFPSMKPGDSFFVEGATRQKVGAVRAAAKDRQKRYPGEKFISRKKANGIRVWRVA